jgi:hypothetical protein
MRHNGERDRIRHPRERLVLVLSALANLAIVAAVVAALLLAPEWLEAHPRLHTAAQRVQTAAVLAVLVLPALAFLRRGRLALLRDNSVRVGRDQVPQIFSILEAHCRVLGLERVPELYVSTEATSELSNAMSFHGAPQAIVLGARLFDGLGRIEDRRDVIAFVLGHELGRLRLGHASWWQDLFLAYLKRIPVLRLPLLTVQTFSRDRLGALLAPEGIRGLLLQAAGGDLLDHMNVATYLRQVMAGPSAWSRLGNLGRSAPHVSSRVRALYHAGFFQLERDLARLEQGTAI